jgi:hypothetical protein
MQDHLAPVVKRVTVIEHDLCDAAGSEHAMNFANRAGGVRRVMQDAIGIDHIKTLIRKRQALAVGNQKSSWNPVDFEMSSGDFDRARCQVGPSTDRSTASKLKQVSSHTAANFQ